MKRIWIGLGLFFLAVASARAALDAAEIIKDIPVALAPTVYWQERRLTLPDSTHDYYVGLVIRVMRDLARFGQTLPEGHFLDWRDLRRNILAGKRVELIWVDSKKFETRKNARRPEMTELSLFYNYRGQNMVTAELGTANYAFHLAIRNDLVLYNVLDGSPLPHGYIEMGLALAGQIFGYLDHFLKRPQTSLIFADAQAMADSEVVARERSLEVEMEFLQWLLGEAESKNFPVAETSHIRQLIDEQPHRGSRVITIDQRDMRRACGEEVTDN